MPSGQPFLARTELTQDERRLVLKYLAENLKSQEVKSGAAWTSIPPGPQPTQEQLVRIAKGEA